MSEESRIPLPNLESGGMPVEPMLAPEPEGATSRIASDLEAVFDLSLIHISKTPSQHSRFRSNSCRLA